MKKTIPFILSVLAIASIASITVLGNTQTAYAGNGCSVNPPTVDLGTFATDVVDVPIGIKEISCSEDVTSVVIDTSDCESKGVFLSFENESIDLGVWTADEIIDFITAPHGIEVHCDVNFDVEQIEGSDFLTQIIWLIPDDPFLPVGGEFLPIDSTALLLAGAQTNAVWILSAFAVIGSVAFGALYITTKRN